MTIKNQNVVPLLLHKTFYTIAFANFLEVHNIVERRNKYVRKFEKEPRKEDELLDFLYTQGLDFGEEERIGMIAVIFSALALEAFISDYGITSFGKSLFKDYLDRLSLAGKWLAFPWLAVHRTFDRTEPTFGSLRKLFRLRNELIHPKARVRGPGKKYTIAKKDASDAIDTVRKAVHGLRRLDQKVDTLWISDSEENCRRNT